jgi:hypothetical protein
VDCSWIFIRLLLGIATSLTVVRDLLVSRGLFTLQQFDQLHTDDLIAETTPKADSIGYGYLPVGLVWPMVPALPWPAKTGSHAGWGGSWRIVICHRVHGH